MIHHTLNEAASSTHLKGNASAISAVVKTIDSALPSAHDMSQRAAIGHPKAIAERSFTCRERIV